MQNNTITFTDEEMEKIRQYRLNIVNVCDLLTCRLIDRLTTEEFIKVLIDIGYEYIENDMYSTSAADAD